MKKLLTFIDNNLLRFGIAFALLFIPLYPKVPSIGIPHVWVYIRLEDFLILVITIIWLVQLIRKKVSLPRPEGYALMGYWAVGLLTLIYCLLFVASHLANFFPRIAALEYFRRIEYMILFFAAFSSVKKQKDIIIYLSTLGVTVTLITLYGFGQKFYTFIWTLFPAFFKQYPFCFPAFLTGNEEFAKGTAFCLNDLSRISSTFGGHYDLAAYLVFIVPIFVALFIVIKKWQWRIFIALLSILALELLNFTSSRTSFAAYLFGVTSMLLVWKKKLWIIPVLAVSIGVLFLFSTSTLQRFAKTIQQVQVVQVQPGSSKENTEIQKIIKQSQENQANIHPQNLQPGTVTVGNKLGNELASSSGQVLTNAELESLKQNNINISTVSGAFLLSKAYALDISITTRFQAEWPRDWQAFLSSPLMGTGYSSLTLASDNDYLRALGETGIVGLLSFLFIFVILGIFMKKTIGRIKDPITKAFLFGLVGGMMGLLINAVLIDVFEASKVAEPLWLLLGIGLGGAKLYQKEPIYYKKELAKFFTSQIMIFIYILLLIITVYISSIGNYFVASDFTWLHWAATAVPSDLLKYWLHAQDFFYRPLDKTIIYFLYSTFSFQPEGFHIFSLLLYFITAVGVYFFARKITHNKLLSILTTFLFVLHPAHSENIFWFSSVSSTLGTIFILGMMLSFITYRERKSIIAYLIAVLCAVLAVASYEVAFIIPFLLFIIDFILLQQKKNKKIFTAYIPFVLLLIVYLILGALIDGGSYNYHISSLLLNVFGNLFGYTGMFFGGLSFLSVYQFLRDGLRTEWLYFTVIMVLLLGYIGWLFSLYQKKVGRWLQQKEIRQLSFCFLFILISLLPFLPLGTIAPRYLYLASVGYTLGLIISFQWVFGSLAKKPLFATWLLVGVTGLLSVVYLVNTMQEQPQWQQSGTITKNTLLFFRKNYSSFSTKTDLYIANMPARINDAWIFQSGFSDGLWFIYRDSMPKVHEMNTLNDALTAQSNNRNNNSYVFLFDDKGNIREVK